jgi:hypothetical protein
MLGKTTGERLREIAGKLAKLCGEQPQPLTVPEHLLTDEQLAKLAGLSAEEREYLVRLLQLAACALRTVEASLDQGSTKTFGHFDNLTRRYRDCDDAVRKVAGEPPLIAEPTHKVLLRSDSRALRVGHAAQKDGNTICRGCANPVGFYCDGKLLGLAAMMGVRLERLRPCDTIELTSHESREVRPLKQTFTIERRSGVCVHLKAL